MRPALWLPLLAAPALLCGQGKPKGLETFLSNFTEADLPNFGFGRPNLSPQQLIEFAVDHRAYNPSASTRREPFFGVSFRDVQKTVARYFGRKLDRAEKVERYTLRDGWYLDEQPWLEPQIAARARIQKVLTGAAGHLRVDGVLYDANESGEANGIGRRHFMALLRPAKRAGGFPYVLVAWRMDAYR